MCYAYSRRSGAYHVGYSGSAGGVNSERQKVRGDRVVPVGMTERRSRRLSQTRGDGGETDFGGDPKRLGRPLCNCAEASALSIAIDWEGDDILEELFFVTFYPVSRGNRFKNPCPNCMTWVTSAAGYCRDGKAVCNRKRRDHDDDDHESGHGARQASVKRSRGMPSARAVQAK